MAGRSGTPLDRPGRENVARVDGSIARGDEPPRQRSRPPDSVPPDGDPPGERLVTDGGVPTEDPVVEALDGAGQAVGLLSAAGTFRYANDAFASLTGYDLEALEGQAWATLYPADEDTSLGEHVPPEADDGPWSGESVWEHRDGSKLVVEHTLSRTDDGGLLCIARRPPEPDGDGAAATAAGRAGDPVRGEPVDALAAGLSAPLTVLDAGGRLQDWNEAVREVTGYDDATLEGMHGMDLVTKADGGQVTTLVAAALRTGRGSVEVGLETAGGTTHPYELVGTRLEDCEDGRAAVAVVWRDLETRRDVRPTLAAADETLSDLLELATSLELTFEERLETALALGRCRLGLSYGFLTRIAGDVQEVVDAHGDHALLQAGESCPLTKAYCRKTIQEETMLGVHDAVAEGWGDDRAYQTFDLGSYLGGKVVVEGSLYGTICFADTDPRDEPFSEAERAFVQGLCSWMSEELAVVRGQESLGDQHERMESFASMAAHDLRGPLSVAHGNLALAEEGVDSEYLSDAQDALDRMDDLIGDMLALARSGGTVEDPVRIEVDTVARAAWDAAGAETATMVVETAGEVRADHDRLLQLFENLFRNAVEHGGATVTVRVGVLDDGLYVADDGPGIPEGRRDRVFERGFTTASDGSGLGLNIVSAIAGAHGWRAEATESADSGARFEFHHVDFPDEQA